MNKEGKRGRTREREGRKADVVKREEEEQSRGEAEHGPEASVFTSSPGPRWAAIGAGAAAALGVAFDATLGICPVWMGRRGRKGSVPLLINLLLQPAARTAQTLSFLSSHLALCSLSLQFTKMKMHSILLNTRQIHN